MDEAKFKKLAALFETRVPFVAFLGMHFASVASGSVRMTVPFRPDLIGNPTIPALHGGVVAALLDTCGGAAVWSQIGELDQVSTVDLRVDYLRPARPERLVGTARVIRLGNRVGVVELRAYHPGASDKPIAVGTGVYNIKRQRAGGAGGLEALVERDTPPRPAS